MADLGSTDPYGDKDAEGEFAEGFEPGSGSSRGWRIAAVLAVIAAIASMVVLGVLLFGNATSTKDDVRACIIDPKTRDFTKQKAGHERPSNCPPAGARKIDGLVTKTHDGGFTIREIKHGKLADATTELYVRTPDRPYINIAHAQTHAALGQPIRVYTLRIDGRDAVVYMEDAPLLQ